MFDNLAKALAWSVLLHLLVITVLWYTHQPVKVVARPQAIEAFVYQPIRSKPTPPAISPAKITPELPPTDNPIATAAIIAKPQPQVEKPIATVQSASKAADQAIEQALHQPNNHSPTTDATHVINPTQAPPATMSLAERSLAIATRRNHDISSEDLAAIGQKPELRDRPAATGKTKLSPDHAAANVMMQLNDGSFIEKVGDYCYLAKPGANLRADIFSMKPVPCGEDRNAALYDRIMSKVGQDR